MRPSVRPSVRAGIRGSQKLYFFNCKIKISSETAVFNSKVDNRPERTFGRPISLRTETALETESLGRE